MERSKFYQKSETRAIGKTFIKSRINISVNFDIKHLRWSKTDLSKETKTKMLRKDTVRISEAVVGRCSVKKVSLKIFPPVYLNIIKIEIKKYTATCLNLSKF